MSALLRAAAERYLKAVAQLGQDSGYNRLTFFEAPISKMPNDELGMEAVKRWRELNDAGQALSEVIKNDNRDSAPPQATCPKEQLAQDFPQYVKGFADGVASVSAAEVGFSRWEAPEGGGLIDWKEAYQVALKKIAELEARVPAESETAEDAEHWRLVAGEYQAEAKRLAAQVEKADDFLDQAQRCERHSDDAWRFVHRARKSLSSTEGK